MCFVPARKLEKVTGSALHSLGDFGMADNTSLPACVQRRPVDGRARTGSARRMRDPDVPGLLHAGEKTLDFKEGIADCRNLWMAGPLVEE